MKIKIPLILISFLAFNACIFTSDDDPGTGISSGVSPMYEPLIMNRAEFENSIQVLAPATMRKAGKIYLQDQLMLLGDTHLGFHVYDNSNPESPLKINFLKIPGATDLAVRNDVVFVNQATDLVAFKFNPQNGNTIIYKRIKNAFPPIISPDGCFASVEEDEVVVGWAIID